MQEERCETSRWLEAGRLKLEAKASPGYQPLASDIQRLASEERNSGTFQLHKLLSKMHQGWNYLTDWLSNLPIVKFTIVIWPVG